MLRKIHEIMRMLCWGGGGGLYLYSFCTGGGFLFSAVRDGGLRELFGRLPAFEVMDMGRTDTGVGGGLSKASITGDTGGVSLSSTSNKRPPCWTPGLRSTLSVDRLASVGVGSTLLALCWTDALLVLIGRSPCNNNGNAMLAVLYYRNQPKLRKLLELNWHWWMAR